MTTGTLKKRPTDDVGEAPAPAGAPGRGVGKIVAAVAAIAFAGVLGVRVRAAMVAKAEMKAKDEKAAHAASQAGAQAADGPLLVRGQPDRWQAVVPLDGTLVPVREADLSFKAPGKLAAIRVRAGDRVREGATLATLDQREVSAQVLAAQAGLKAAQAQLALADDAAHRTGLLVQSGTASQAAGIQSGGQQQLATAQVEVARAQLQLATASLANHTLLAPFSGTVTRVPAGPGAVVSPGVALFHVQDTSKLKLVATASEVDAELLHVGDAVEVRTADGKVTTGQVSAILPSVDTATRRVPIEALVPNEKNPLLGGLFVRASVRSAREVPVLRLPASALRPGSQDEIFVVESGRLHSRRVVYVPGAEGELLVRRGLSEGEDVLRAPSAEVHDGMPATAAK